MILAERILWASSMKRDEIHPSWFSTLKQRAEGFTEKYLPKNINCKKVANIGLSVSMVASLVTEVACSATPVYADTQPTANATQILETKREESEIPSGEVPAENIHDATPTTEIDMTTYAIPDATATEEELKPLVKNFGLTSYRNFQRYRGYNVDQMIQIWTDYYPDKSYLYGVYTSANEAGFLASSTEYKTSKIFDKLQNSDEVDLTAVHES